VISGQKATRAITNAEQPAPSGRATCHMPHAACELSLIQPSTTGQFGLSSDSDPSSKISQYKPKRKTWANFPTSKDCRRTAQSKKEGFEHFKYDRKEQKSKKNVINCLYSTFQNLGIMNYESLGFINISISTLVKE